MAEVERRTSGMTTGLLAGTVLLVCLAGLGAAFLPTAGCPSCAQQANIAVRGDSCKRCTDTRRVTLLNKWLGDRRPVPSECRIVEQVYYEGWKVCGEIVVHVDGSYSFSQINLWSQPPATKVVQGRLPDSIARSVLEAGRDDARFKEGTGIPTYEFGVDNWRIAHPSGINELLTYLRTQIREAK
jgi:hypothetical protein